MRACLLKDLICIKRQATFASSSTGAKNEIIEGKSVSLLSELTAFSRSRSAGIDVRSVSGGKN